MRPSIRPDVAAPAPELPAFKVNSDQLQKPGLLRATKYIQGIALGFLAVAVVEAADLWAPPVIDEQSPKS